MLADNPAFWPVHDPNTDIAICESLEVPAVALVILAGLQLILHGFVSPPIFTLGRRARNRFALSKNTEGNTNAIPKAIPAANR